MKISGSYIFFETKEDYMSNCMEDPYCRGYILKNSRIEYPHSFPAAFAWEADFDPRCVGSYIEVPFQDAIKNAISSLSETKKQIDKTISELEKMRFSPHPR